MSTAIRQADTIPRVPAITHAEAILAAVVFGAQKFLNEPDFTGVLDAWLEQLGAATGAGQVRIFTNDERVAGEPVRASLSAQWIAPGTNPGSPLESLQHIPYREVGCGRWEEMLSRGESVVGNVEDLPESEQQITRMEGLVSVAIVPVFAGSRWWGFMGFGDCRTKRTWEQAELNALSAAAGIYGAAIARREMERRLEEALAQERLAAEIGEVLTASIKNLDEILQLYSIRVLHHLRADLVRSIDHHRRASCVGS
jgi:GAF domain-containing protein